MSPQNCDHKNTRPTVLRGIHGLKKWKDTVPHPGRLCVDCGTSLLPEKKT